jgi:tetratricopeptide (TPR) repeat protein
MGSMTERRPASPEARAAGDRARWTTPVAAATLVLACVVVFAGVRQFAFVSWDDPSYVTNNPNVAGGLSWHALRWALIASGGYYWHPLTWLSHMLDVQLYGLAPGPHHVTSLLLHILATLLLFWFLSRTTRSRGRSLVVAMLFAVHPLHVESVAWVAERKDVLSGVLFMATLVAYAWYADRPNPLRYAVVLLGFLLGLMAKPMVVTLPAVLLLLDAWPLRRFEQDGGRMRSRQALRLLVEKLPLVALAALSAGLTVMGQVEGGALRPVSTFPLALRLANALVSYVTYIGQMFWPSGLAAFYPYPLAIPFWQALAAVLLLVGLSVGAWRLRRQCPYLLVGWLWYVVTLLPVIGLVQVGDQAMADRFTYVPLVGLFMALAWGVSDAARRWRYGRLALTVASGVLLVSTTVAATEQVQYWRDSLALWGRAATVTRDNERAHANLGTALQQAGRAQEAIDQYREAARLLSIEAAAAHVRASGAATMHVAAGILLMQSRRASDAADEFLAAVAIKPEDADIHHNLAVALDAAGRQADAATHHAAAARLRPGDAQSQANACVAFANLGRLNEAIPLCLEALRLDPSRADWHYDVGLMLLDSGAAGQAAAHFRAALALEPRMDGARRELDRLSEQGIR